LNSDKLQLHPKLTIKFNGIKPGIDPDSETQQTGMTMADDSTLNAIPVINGCRRAFSPLDQPVATTAKLAIASLSPQDLLATIDSTLGIDLPTQFHDNPSRPVPILSDGHAVTELLL
jgi:hypothetical protein